MTDTERDGDSSVYAVIAESKAEGPLLWETTGAGSSYDSAVRRMEEALARPNIIRAAIVRLQATHFGNELLLTDMRRMQK